MPVMDGAIVGRGYSLREHAGVATPVFTFHAPDLERARALLRDMYVELDVHFDDTGQLAYHLGVPDRQLTPAAIAVEERDISRLAAAPGRPGPAVEIHDDNGGSISLTHLGRELAHDWTRNYARAMQAFLADDLDAAIAPLQFLIDTRTEVPAVHHLLGRCHRARGDLQTAVHHYLGAVRRACASDDDRMLPAAAGPLADLGVAFKRLGMTGKAAHCLLHALHLRPNHPEALLSFVTLFPQADALVLHALARVIHLGGRDEMVDQAIDSITTAAGTDPLALRRAAHEAAPRVDLAVWPLTRGDLERYSTFHDGFDRLAVPAPATIPPTSGPIPDAIEAVGDEARPWWKFW